MKNILTAFDTPASPLILDNPYIFDGLFSKVHPAQHVSRRIAIYHLIHKEIVRFD